MEEVQCDREGLCTLTRTCELSCSDLYPNQPELFAVEEPLNGVDNKCGDYPWGACLDSCAQSKMSSVLMSDGLCHEERMHREGRSCHVDFCGRSDPCRIPFIVHVILGFRGADHSNWSRPAEDCVVNAFAAVTNSNQHGIGYKEFFDAGDVKILMSSPWYEGKEPGESSGIKVVLEVSLYNPKAVERSEGMDPDVLTWGSRSRKLSECKDSDMYPLAIKAHEIHTKVNEAHFMEDVIAALKNDPTVSVPTGSLFARTVSDPRFIQGSIVFSSWTIATETSGEAIYDHKIDAYLDHRDSVQVVLAYLHNYVILIFVLLLAIIIFCTGNDTPKDERDENEKDHNGKKPSARRRVGYFASRGYFASSLHPTQPLHETMPSRDTSTRKRRDKFSRCRIPYYDEGDADGQFTDGGGSYSSGDSKYSKLNSIITN